MEFGAIQRTTVPILIQAYLHSFWYSFHADTKYFLKVQFPVFFQHYLSGHWFKFKLTADFKIAFQTVPEPGPSRMGNSPTRRAESRTLVQKCSPGTVRLATALISEEGIVQLTSNKSKSCNFCVLFGDVCSLPCMFQLFWRLPKRWMCFYTPYDHQMVHSHQPRDCFHT